jgi:hypothetical protein
MTELNFYCLHQFAVLEYAPLDVIFNFRQYIKRWFMPGSLEIYWKLVLG